MSLIKMKGTGGNKREKGHFVILYLTSKLVSDKLMLDALMTTLLIVKDVYHPLSCCCEFSIIYFKDLETSLASDACRVRGNCLFISFQQV